MKQVVIAGAGVIGLSLAYELAGRGARVTLVDRALPGRESSWAGAGILTPASLAGARRPVDLLRAHSLRLLAEWSQRLHAETGIDGEISRCGALELALTPEDRPALERAAAEWRAQGVAVEEVPPERLPEVEPALTSGVAAAHRLPGEAQIRNPRHTQALVAGCDRRGVEIRTGSPAEGLETAAGRVTALRAGGDRLVGDAFVIAAGAWSGDLLAQANVRLAVRPVRGQIVLLEAGSPILRQILWLGSRYLVPRRDGRVLIGSTEEEAGFDARPTAAGVRGLLELGLRTVPALAGHHFERAWAGLRPGSVDGLPYLGLAPGYDNLYVAAGHFRAGFELSAGTALVMSELILGETPSVPLEEFRPDRA